MRNDVDSANADSSAQTGIEFANTIAKLDSTASDIVSEQRDALVQRKDLAQRTKDFRKLDDSSKLGEYKGLLKGAPCLGHSLILLLTPMPNSLPSLH